MANQRDKTIGENKGEFLLNVKGGEEVKSQLYVLIVRFILLSAIKVMATCSSFTICVNCIQIRDEQIFFIVPNVVNVNENMFCMIGTKCSVLACFTMRSKLSAKHMHCLIVVRMKSFLVSV